MATTAPTGYRPGVVTMHMDPTAHIPCFLPEDGRHWNGWALPVFPEDTFQTHREAWQALFPEVDNEEQTTHWPVWIDDAPSIVFHYDDGPEQQVQLTAIHGVAVYSVGSGMVWEEVE